MLLYTIFVLVQHYKLFDLAVFDFAVGTPDGDDVEVGAVGDTRAGIRTQQGQKA